MWGLRSSGRVWVCVMAVRFACVASHVGHSRARVGRGTVGDVCVECVYVVEGRALCAARRVTRSDTE